MDKMVGVGSRGLPSAILRLMGDGNERTHHHVMRELSPTVRRLRRRWRTDSVSLYFSSLMRQFERAGKFRVVRRVRNPYGPGRPTPVYVAEHEPGEISHVALQEALDSW